MSDSGQTLAEYTAVLAMIAGIIAVLSASGMAHQVEGGIQSAICAVTQQEGCAVPQADGPRDTGPDAAPPRNPDTGEQVPNSDDDLEGIQDPRSPNPLSDYCAIDIGDGTIEGFLADYCSFRASGLDPNEAYEELVKRHEALDYNAEHHDRDSDKIITGWWMATNPGWWNGGSDTENWSDDAVAAMLMANDQIDGPWPAPGTEAWDETIERWEEQGVDGIEGWMQAEYESALQSVWREEHMDDLHDLIVGAGLEAGPFDNARR